TSQPPGLIGPPPGPDRARRTQKSHDRLQRILLRMDPPRPCSRLESPPMGRVPTDSLRRRVRPALQDPASSPSEMSSRTSGYVSRSYPCSAAAGRRPQIAHGAEQEGAV